MIKINQNGEKSNISLNQVFSRIFNIYMSKLSLSPTDINIMAYADDITLTTSLAQVEKLRDIITPRLTFLHDCIISRQFKLPVEKSINTAITTWIMETNFEPQLNINNTIKINSQNS